MVIDLDLRRASAVELATKAKAGSDTAFQELARRLIPALRAMASNYWAEGLTREDLMQEALMGVSEACHAFRPDGGRSMETFAVFCAQRKVITAVKTAHRGKHRAVNEAISFQVFSGENDRPASGDMSLVFMDHRADVEQHLELREELQTLLNCAHTRLSDLEQEALRLYLADHDYQAIADELEITPKAVDNALQRGRRKLSEAMAVAA